MTPAYPSRDLDADSRFCAHHAAAMNSIGHAGDRWKMLPAYWQRHLEAKARLYSRAGDAAAACGDGGPVSPVYTPAPSAGEP